MYTYIYSYIYIYIVFVSLRFNIFWSALASLGQPCFPFGSLGVLWAAMNSFGVFKYSITSFLSKWPPSESPAQSIKPPGLHLQIRLILRTLRIPRKWCEHRCFSGPFHSH